MPANPFYTSAGIPQDGQERSADALRSEFLNIETGFSRFPDFGTVGVGKALVIGLSGVDAITPPWALAASPATTGVGTHSTTSAPGRIFERTNSTGNVIDEYRTSTGSVFAGMGSTGEWAAGGTSDLSSAAYLRASASGIKVLGSQPVNYLESGTYNPTFSFLDNVSSAVGDTWRYIRVGSMVVVSGTVFADVIDENLIGDFSATLPFATNITSIIQVTGSMVEFEGTSFGNILARPSNDTARFQISAAHSVGVQYTFMFMVSM